jgi:hypothetical protein
VGMVYILSGQYDSDEQDYDVKLEPSRRRKARISILEFDQITQQLGFNVDKCFW